MTEIEKILKELKQIILFINYLTSIQIWQSS